MRWVTFDCFGTLVDWHGGFSSILRPLAGGRTADLLTAYHRFERQIESAQPHRLYKDVLTTSLALASREVGLPFADSQARALANSWGALKVFEDVEPMLAVLRSEGYRLAVLTNCDDDLFAQTHRAFALPFDMVVTAEQVGSYKPALGHFTRFRDVARPSAWVHVACSWFHDIVPALEMGIPRIWFDRDDTGDDPGAASVRVTSAADVGAAVRTLT